LIVIMLVAWPGLVRIHPRTLAGYWASQTTGGLYKVRPDHGRTFVVSTRRGLAIGTIRGLRGVRVAFPGDDGSRGGRVEIGDRRIIWNDGDAWVLQGVR
jgi:hypothetical protein